MIQINLPNGETKDYQKPVTPIYVANEISTSLAKEAMSSGDKTLSENYLQHADHFMRIIDEKNKNKIISENKTSDSNNLSENKKDFSQETSINQNKNSENKT